MATANDVISLAASFLGVHEEPPGSNNVIFNTDYYGYPVSGASYPWCCAYVWDIFRMAGASELFYDGRKTAYCPTVAQWAYETGRDRTFDEAEYGDLVLFDWDGDGVADHIGFVVGLNGGVLETIEGNTSDTDHSNGGWVLGRRRYRESVLMIVHIDYDEVYMFDVSPIKYGACGNDVRLWQILLRGYKIKGADGKQMVIDGSFGENVKFGTKEFQRKKKLPITGEVDNATWKKALKR